MRILLVDDNPDDLILAKRALRPLHLVWQVVAVDSAAQAIVALERGTFDIIISDLAMPGIDGARLLAFVKQAHPAMRRLMLHSGARIHAELAPVCQQQLLKPFEPASLRSAIAKACYAQG